MRSLVVTKIFPNAEEPMLGPYNRLKFGALNRRGPVTLLAMVPWLPGIRRFGPAASRRRARIPRRERVDDLWVRHPRVLYAPKVGRPLSGALYAASLLPWVMPLRGQVDVVIGSFAYPDGFAAVVVGRLLGVPTGIECLGSDVNVLGADPLLIPALRWSFARAAAVVAPSQPLIDKVVALGADPARVRVMGTGIDKDLFCVRDAVSTRAALGFTACDDRRWFVFVGRLERAKGALDLLEALARLRPDQRDRLQLVMVGDGADRAACEAAAAGLPVHFTGVVAPPLVADWLAAADVMVLPSWAEGKPNVVLEALTCGRRVLATDVGGIPSVVDRPELGTLVPPRDPARLAVALAEELERPRADAASIAAAVAHLPSWDDVGAELYEVLRGVASRNRPVEGSRVSA
ncbi:MAG: glycosyltransferase [Myxococcota bacterium]